MSRVVHPQYRSENQGSKYPFSDTSLMVSITRQTIPREFFIDAAVHIPDSIRPVWITSITLSRLTATVQIGDATGALCSGVVDLDPTAPGITPLYTAARLPAGLLVHNQLFAGGLQSWPSGVHLFAPNTTVFAASVVAPVPSAGVRAIGAESSDGLSGDVWLVGENGINLTVLDNNQIRVDVVGNPLWKREVCAGTQDFNPPTFVTQINGQLPNAGGNFQIVAGRGLNLKTPLRVFVEGDTLNISLAGKGGV
jgi:hypothetical protein